VYYRDQDLIQVLDRFFWKDGWGCVWWRTTCIGIMAWPWLLGIAGSSHYALAFLFFSFASHPLRRGHIRKYFIPFPRIVRDWWHYFRKCFCFLRMCFAISTLNRQKLLVFFACTVNQSANKTNNLLHNWFISIMHV
jgi:hypothetical protein